MHNDSFSLIIDCIKIKKRRCPIRLAIKHQFVLLIATGALFLISRLWNFVVSVLRFTIAFFWRQRLETRSFEDRLFFVSKFFFVSRRRLFVVFIGWSFYGCLMEHTSKCFFYGSTQKESIWKGRRNINRFLKKNKRFVGYNWWGFVHKFCQNIC